MRAVLDSIHIADSLFSIDSAAMMKKSSLERPAFSTAKDSVVEVFSDGQRKIYYYGDVTVKYGNMELSADYMEYDMKTGTVYAKGTLDTLTGEVKGQPKMKEGGSEYSMEEVRYNFNSRKARITNMITQQEDGLLHGKNIKMLPDRSINITKANILSATSSIPTITCILLLPRSLRSRHRKRCSGLHTLSLRMFPCQSDCHSDSFLSVRTARLDFSCRPSERRTHEVSI